MRMNDRLEYVKKWDRDELDWSTFDKDNIAWLKTNSNDYLTDLREYVRELLDQGYAIHCDSSLKPMPRLYCNNLVCFHFCYSLPHSVFYELQRRGELVPSREYPKETYSAQVWVSPKRKASIDEREAEEAAKEAVQLGFATAREEL